MSVVTTLSFFGKTEEALQLYCDSLDAEILFLMRFRDCPDKSFMKPGLEDMIFHASFRIDGTELKASDVGCSGNSGRPNFAGFSLALRLESIERAREGFAALSKGGQVAIPLGPSSFTDWYGIVIDRFGLSWKFIVENS